MSNIENKSAELGSETAAREARENSSLSFVAIVFYALPVMASQALVAPTPSVIPGMYNKYFGLDMAVIGSVYFAVRFINAVASPLLGYLADKYRVSNRSRKVWVFTGGVGLLICGYFLYIPPENVSAVYFLFWFTGLFLCNALLDLSHIAWGAELTRSNANRTRLFTTRAFVMQIGMLFLFALPLLPLFETTEYTPEVLAFSLPIIALIFLISLLCMLRLVPDGQPLQAPKTVSLFKSVHAVYKNRPFQIFAGMAFLSATAMGIGSGLTFLVIDSYFKIGDKFPVILVVAVVVGMACLPAVNYVIGRCGKLRVLKLALVLACITPLLYLLVPSGAQSFIPVMLITSIQSIMVVSLGVIFPVLISDAADYGVFKTGIDQAASYVSVNQFIVTIGYAFGGFIGFAIAGLLNFDTSNNPSVSELKLAVQVVYCLLPGVLQIFAVMMSFKLPLTEARMATVSASLKKRAAKVQASQQEIHQHI